MHKENPYGLCLHNLSLNVGWRWSRFCSQRKQVKLWISCCWNVLCAWTNWSCLFYLTLGIAFVQLDCRSCTCVFYCTCLFLKYTFNMCLNFELWTFSEYSSATFTPKLVYTYTITLFRGANGALSAGVTNIWPLKNTRIRCYSKSSGAKHAQEAGVVLHHSNVALERCYLSTQR